MKNTEFFSVLSLRWKPKNILGVYSSLAELSSL